MKITISATITIENPTPEIIEAVTRINTHNNPKYIQAQEQGRSTYKIDRYIEDYLVTDDLIAFPRGCFPQLELDMTGCMMVDRRTTYPVEIPQPTFVLRDYQKQVFDEIGDKQNGVIVAPTGAGKTVLGIELIARQQQRALILVHTKGLLRQWIERIASGLNIDPDSIGVIGNGKWAEGELITVAMLQTKTRNIDKASQLQYGLVLIDEAHHSPASTFAKVLDSLPAVYRYGLSATPQRRDGLEAMLYNRIGEKLCEIDKTTVESVGSIIPAQVKVFKTGIPVFVDSWNDYLTEITESEDRNQMIADLAIQASGKMPTLVLTDRVDHAQRLHALSGGVLLHGKLKKADREKNMQAANESHLTIGTTGLLGEGIDVSGWQCLILATPISSRGRLLQAIGRVIRPAEGKDMAFIADLVDDCGFSVSSFNKRKAVYHERGYRVGHAG
jgi:superfamily II DNA or RNA helicase